MNRFLLVFVYRNDLGDSTNNGVTSPNHNNRFYVPHPQGPTLLEDLDEKAVVLIPGKSGNAMHFKPRDAKGWTMAGGNFVYTSDSRFGELYGRQPVSVHDRIE